MPVPLVAASDDPITRPAVLVIPLIIAVQGPLPVIEPTEPVALIVADATLPNSIFLSSTVSVDELIVVVVPLTVRLPVTTKSLLTVVVLLAPADDAPMFTTVLPPSAPPVPMFIVFVVNAVAAPVEIFVVLFAVPL